MSFLTPQSQLDYEDSRRRGEVSYYVGNPERRLRGHLFDFCVDILGYDALSESFHKPMLDAWDRLDLRRWRIFLGLDPIDDKPIDRLDLWPRGHIKTWCQRAAVLRYWLINPVASTVTWWHAVEEKATESGMSLAEVIQKNTKYRALHPAGVLPAMNRKKFMAGGSFRFNCQRVGDAPIFSAYGAGGEATGAHSLIGVGDDFVGWNDVVDNQMTKKKQFYRGTVCNVVMRTNKVRGWKDFIGTHWAVDDPYVDWRESPDWICTTRACLETDGKPDSDGTPVYLSREQIEKEKREQGSVMFAFQMMNDPSPASEKPWNPAECEHPVLTKAEAAGPGWVVVFGDPAPRAVGSVGGKNEKFFGDGVKDFWALAAVKMRRKGELLQMILLDADQSRDWDLDEGMARHARMAVKWHANELYAETTQTPVYLERLIRAKRDEGAKGYVIGSRKLTMGDADDRLKNTYNANAKVNYITALCARAKQVEFVFCETAPLAMREELLKQARGFMPMAGHTGIRFDDLINAIAFATDPYFRTRYPEVTDKPEWSPYRTTEIQTYDQGGRYVRW